MAININYFFQNCLVTLITMACIHAFLYVNKAIPKEIKVKFLALTFVLILESLESYADSVLKLVEDNSMETLRIAVSAFGYTVRPLMLYMVLLIMLREVKEKYKKVLLAVPTMITFVISLMAFFTDWVFSYDENNNFHGGPLRYVFFAILLIYFIIILVVNVINSRKNKSEGRVLFGVIGLLVFDWVYALVSDVIGLHAQLESLSVILYFMYFLTNYHAESMVEKEQEFLDSEQRLTKMMLDQSIETLAYTIDAKDRYTKGHSFRVAKYSRMIAGMVGKSEEECREIYLAGLLHDIGKISISGTIINKQGKLTDEEYEKIKTHPEKGALILEKMKSIPFLQNGAKYHHERFDGKGYPSGLKGTEIPDMARIIAVADAYDAMTSYRSYRPTMEQNLVKQEIWKGMGTQFDPLYAKVMISLIDADPNYEMREIPNKQDEMIFDDHVEQIVWPSTQSKELSSSTVNKSIQSEGLSTMASFIRIEDKWSDVTSGFSVTNEPGRIHFTGKTRQEAPYVWCTPIVLVYVSDDGEVLGPGYTELGVFMSAGYGWQAGPSLYEYSYFSKERDFESWENWLTQNKAGLTHTVCAHMEGNMVVLSMENGLLTMHAHLAVPEEYKSRIRVAFSGLMCDLSDVKKL